LIKIQRPTQHYTGHIRDALPADLLASTEKIKIKARRIKPQYNNLG